MGPVKGVPILGGSFQQFSLVPKGGLVFTSARTPESHPDFLERSSLNLAAGYIHTLSGWGAASPCPPCLLGL